MAAASGSVGRAGRIVVDPACCRTGRELSGQLSTVQAVYQRCRQHVDALDVDKINVSHSGYRRRPRRPPCPAQHGATHQVTAGRSGDAGGRGAGGAGIRRAAQLLRLLYRPDRPRGGTLPTTPRGGGRGEGVPEAPKKIDLRQLAGIADKRFDLTIREYAPYDRVDRVHPPGSFHYRGRAFDASGRPADMTRFANWAADHYGKRLAELFWNGPNARNIDNGRPIPRGTVPGHTVHVHVVL